MRLRERGLERQSCRSNALAHDHKTERHRRRVPAGRTAPWTMKLAPRHFRSCLLILPRLGKRCLARGGSLSIVQTRTSPYFGIPPSRARRAQRAPVARRELAAAHLHRTRLLHCWAATCARHGEIDLIAFDGATLVFAEVKARRVGAQQTRIRSDQEPLSRLHRRQRARLRRLATVWLSEEGRIRPTAHVIRFDAIGVLLDTRGRLLRLDHVAGAW